MTVINPLIIFSIDYNSNPTNPIPFKEIIKVLWDILRGIEDEKLRIILIGAYLLYEGIKGIPLNIKEVDSPTCIISNLFLILNID